MTHYSYVCPFYWTCRPAGLRRLRVPRRSAGGLGDSGWWRCAAARLVSRTGDAGAVAVAGRCVRDVSGPAAAPSGDDGGRPAGSVDDRPPPVTRGRTGRRKRLFRQQMRPAVVRTRKLRRCRLMLLMVPVPSHRPVWRSCITTCCPICSGWSGRAEALNSSASLCRCSAARLSSSSA